ncbi:phosphate ABC transporter substrate-binding protein PstS [Actinoplanes sp. DH11]|uniref:phosphate ABC transporter substrate-binding protein PstS n=1 Tax=Actinoplanes sp. DH11 TaxID=2857011 RepID=UPI001E55A0D5|nr:phosphate ABC transporter substrate-binding protein PstS [Actinoplanes sp. DH11]
MKARTAVLLPLLLVLAGCAEHPEPGPPPIACAAGTTGGQGSSAQTNALQAWIKEYQIACPEAAIQYTSTGSGAGVRAFLAGDGDFAGTDTPLSAADRTRAEQRCGGPVVQLPLVAGPIALAYNVAGVGELRLTPETIARIFSGVVRVWNDPAVAADNPAAALPATEIRTIHRADNSGTTENFTRYLTAAAPAAWRHGSSGDWRAPGGAAERGSHRVAAAVARTEGAIGYVESSYASVNDLPVVSVGGDGRFVAPTNSAAGAAIENAGLSDADGAVRLDASWSGGTAGYAYPLVLISYEVVCRTGASALTRAFLAHAAGAAGQDTAQAAGYAALPEALRNRVAQTVAALR